MDRDNFLRHSFCWGGRGWGYTIPSNIVHGRFGNSGPRTLRSVSGTVHCAAVCTTYSNTLQLWSHRLNGLVHLNWRGDQSTTGSRGVRISGSNAGYTVFWGRVRDYWLPTPLACFPFTSPTVRHRVPSGFNWALLLNAQKRGGRVCNKPFCPTLQSTHVGSTWHNYCQDKTWFYA